MRHGLLFSSLFFAILLISCSEHAAITTDECIEDYTKGDGNSQESEVEVGRFDKADYAGVLTGLEIEGTTTIDDKSYIAIKVLDGELSSAAFFNLRWVYVPQKEMPSVEIAPNELFSFSITKLYKVVKTEGITDCEVGPTAYIIAAIDICD